MMLMEVEMLTDELLFDREYLVAANIVGEEMYEPKEVAVEIEEE